MKKILLLGGSEQQIVAIEAAKKLGIYTVLCDYLPDNPGQYIADKFYLVSTTDKDAVLDVATEENIDGILAYASDPAAPTAAYVAEKLGLPTNPFAAVDTLCNKDKFRIFLRENGFNTPFAKGYDSDANPVEDTKLFRLPVIVKPVDSSGSKGATVLHSYEKLSEAVNYALSYSRSKRYIIEEFIEFGYPCVVGGDVFVEDGTVKIWGLMDCHRDSKVNPLVPVGKSYPVGLEDSILDRVKKTIQRLITCIGYQTGSVNVELIVDKDNKVWPIDFGPRCGGNMIPVLMRYIFGIDVTRLAVCAAMGMELDYQINEFDCFFATHNLHTERNGTLREICFSDMLKPHILDVHMYLNPGDHVEYFDNAAKAIGIVFFRFENKSVMADMLEHIDDHITIQIDA